MKYFKATWGWGLILVSALATAMLVGMPVVGLLATPREPRLVQIALIAVPLVVLLGCALFTIRGYTIIGDSLLVHRLLWATALPLAGLQSASFEPGAMRWSLRLWGNGGLFSFSGRYRSRQLGSFRAFVTDLNRTVVLRYPTETIVVSPEAPEQFVVDVATR